MSRGRPPARLALEVAAELVLASVERALLPERRMAARLGQPVPGRPDAPDVGDAVGASAPRPDLVLLRRAVDGVANRLPWRPRCLVRAVAAQRMLRRRGWPALLHLGVAPGPPLRAHAWVTSDGHVVVGGAGATGFAPVAVSSLPPRR